MGNSNLKFVIYDFRIQLFLDSQDVCLKIEKDFSYFIRLNNTQYTKSMSIHSEKVETIIIPKGLKATKQSQNSITYDDGHFRYNDYYGHALTVLNYKTEEVKIYYKKENFLHELIYLIILSRSGKFMDQAGLHKIHASAFTINRRSIILMMPSQGGKTTTLLEVLKDENISLISDDTPCVDSWGELYPFPLRIGHENKEKLLEYFPYISDSEFYQFERRYFTKKYLISTQSLKNKVKIGEKIILLQGIRTTFEKTQIYKVNKFKGFKFLVENMIVGVGLPMVIEYFLANKIWDHFVNVLILFKRVFSSINLLRKSEIYEVYLSNNPVEVAESIKAFFDER